MIRLPFLILLGLLVATGVYSLDSLEFCGDNCVDLSREVAADGGLAVSGGSNWLFDTSHFPARWFCGQWTSLHGWLHIVSDVLIWLAYTSIPIALFVLVVRRKEQLPYKWLWVMFSVFILSCGLTHLMEALIFWWPAYRFLGLLKLLTAIVSVATALALLPVLPKLLKMKTVEQFDEKLAQSLAAKNEQLELVTAGISVGIWDWSVETGDTWWSPQFYRLLGYRPGEIVNTYDSYFKEILHPDHKDLMLAAINQHFESGEHYKLEVKMRCKDGSYRWFEVSGKAKFASDGKPVRMVGSITDIQARKELEEKDHESILKLTAQKNRLQSFAYIVSHDLRSHTGNMQALVTHLLEEDDESAREEVLGFIEKNADQLHNTVEELNEVLKIQTELAHSKVDLPFQHQVDEVLSILSEKIEESEAVVETDFSSVRSIEYVPAYLSSIFLNLIGNAIKYRSPDRAPHVSIKTARVGERVQLTVADNGLGIDLARHGKKLFGLHKTFHRHPEARGVGLFLIKNQIEALGGTIDVESELGKGSTFVVKF